MAIDHNIPIRLYVKDDTDEGFDKAETRTQQFERKMSRSTGGLITGFDKLAIAAGLVGAGTVALGVASSMASANMEMLRLRLEQVTGSAEEGARAYDFLVSYSARTPFQLPDIIQAAASLEAFGAKAIDTITPIGDLAVFMGVEIPEAAEAFGRAFSAGAGAADILRERGVLNLIRLQTGIDDLTKLTLPEFREAMLDAFTDPEGRIAGGTAKLAETLGGKFSTLKDNVVLLSAAIGDRLSPRLKETIDNLTPMISDLTLWIDKTKQTKQLLDELATAIEKQEEKLRADNAAIGEAVDLNTLWEENTTGVIKPLDDITDILTFQTITVFPLHSTAIDNSRAQLSDLATQAGETAKALDELTPEAQPEPVKWMDFGVDWKAMEEGWQYLIGQPEEVIIGLDSLRREMELIQVTGEEMSASMVFVSETVGSAWRSAILTMSESTASFRDAVGNFWQSIKISALAAIADITWNFIESQIKITAATGAQAAVRATAKTGEVIASRAVASAATSEAAAEIFAAHAWIPFAGVGISSGMIATMMAELAAVEALSVFHEGGYVKGVGERLALLEAGEYVVSAPATSMLGIPFLEALNKMPASIPFYEAGHGTTGETAYDYSRRTMNTWHFHGDIYDRDGFIQMIEREIDEGRLVIAGRS